MPSSEIYEEEEQFDQSEESGSQTESALVSVSPSLNEIQMQTSMALLQTLKNNCPVMSGNHAAHIDFFEFEPSESILVLSAPHYDVSEWKKTGAIMFDGGTDYAKLLNSAGAFGKGGKDVGWVDRSVRQGAEAIASLYNAIVIVL